MPELTFWNVKKGDKKKRLEFHNSLSKQLVGKSSISLMEDILLNNWGDYLIAGTSIDNTLGIAVYKEGPYSKNVNEASELANDETLVLNSVFRGQRNRHDLSIHPGYDEYTGEGKIAYVGLLETFKQGRGIGSLILDELKERDYELIELISDSKAVEFYEKNHFEHTGLVNLMPRGPVMVWNSPDYAKPL